MAEMFKLENEPFPRARMGYAAGLAFPPPHLTPLAPIKLDKKPGLAICRIRTTFSTNPPVRSYGTGFWVADDRIVTAGHVLYKRSLKGYAEWVEVFGLATPNTSKPTAVWRLRNYAVPKTYADGSDRTVDVGVVAAPRPARAARLDMKAVADDLLTGRVALAGYPAPRAQAHGIEGAITHKTRATLYHASETAEGLSGGPVYSPDADVAVGLHVRGYGDELPDGVPPSAAAVRFTPAIIDWIDSQTYQEP